MGDAALMNSSDVGHKNSPAIKWGDAISREARSQTFDLMRDH
jgi:hypothetical protein